MHIRQTHKHFIDIIFLLVLLCLFLVSSVLLLIMGTHIYQHTIKQMNTNYNTRTAFAYITEKCQQLDTYNAVSVGSFGDSDSLVLSQNIQGTTYNTILYFYDDELRELFSKADSTLSPAAGQNILACTQFQITQIKSTLYHVQITTEENETLSLYITLQSGGYSS